jgi:hypothetical protein
LAFRLSRSLNVCISGVPFLLISITTAPHPWAILDVIHS